MKNIKCPLCGKETRYHFTIERFKPSFDIYRCQGCQILFQYPFLEKKTIENYYHREYYEGNAPYSYEDERAHIFYYEKVWKKRVKLISKYGQKKIGNFLDIGCSFGGLLKVAQDAGFYPYGIEISEYCRHYCKDQMGLKHIKSSFKELDSVIFSFITMVEVIEHLKDPLNVLQFCFDHLEKGGVLLIQTANLNSLQAILQGKKYSYYLPGHLFYFSEKNLIYYLQLIGFSTVKVFKPVEFGLMAKLLKSRGTFKSFWDYRKWLRIIFYHYISYLKLPFVSVTSSMVLYAKK